MSQARVLYDLQQIDTEIRTKKQHLGEVLRLQKEPATLVAARERVREAEADLSSWRARQQALNLEIASLTDKIKRSEERLYSGEVKNTKELTDLQHEVEALGRRRVGLEDEALQMMMTLDERQAAKTAADSEADLIEGEFSAACVSYKQEQNTLAMQLNKLLEKRQRQVALTQPSALKIYDELSRQKNGGIAVAALRGNKCLGCQLTLSNSTVRSAEEGKLVFCDSCGRILCPI